MSFVDTLLEPASAEFRVAGNSRGSCHGSSHSAPHRIHHVGSEVAFLNADVETKHLGQRFERQAASSLEAWTKAHLPHPRLTAATVGVPRLTLAPLLLLRWSSAVGSGAMVHAAMAERAGLHARQDCALLGPVSPFVA